MRNLFLFLLLLALVAFLGHGQDALEPVAAAGFLFVGSLLTSGLARRTRIPSFIGALAAGALLGFMGPESAESTRPFAMAAATWVGLHLGVSLLPGLLRVRVLLVAAGGFVACPFLVTIAVLLILGQSAQQALPLAIIASATAPVFFIVADRTVLNSLTGRDRPDPRRAPAAGAARRRTIPLLVAILNLGLWGLYLLLSQRSLPADPTQLALGLLIWLAGIEAVFRTLSLVRTDPGRHIFVAILVLGVWTGASRAGFHPLFAGLVTGLALSIRSQRQRRPLECFSFVAGPLAALLTAFFSATLPWGMLFTAGPAIWGKAAVLAGCGITGKIAGGLLSRNLTGSPFREWSGVMPQGLVGGLLLLTDAAGAGASELVPAFILIAGAGVWALLRPIEAWVGRREAASR